MITPADRTPSADEQREAWLARSLALLDASADALDAATLSRLNRARRMALAQRSSRHRSWMLGSGLAGAAIALLLMLGATTRHETDPQQLANGSDDGADVVAATDDLDLYQNLDFYQWLDQQQGDNG